MDLVRKIYEAGVVGAGGAGFPTHIKFNTKVNTLLINAAECEPLLFTDQYEMENFAEEIVKGIALSKVALGAETVKIGIKEKHIKSISALESAIEKLEEPIEIVKMQSYYPAGDEHSIVYECLGKALQPGALPSSLGAVVCNVTTVRNIYLASIGKAVTHKKITITGEVKHPAIVNVPIGTLISECIELGGGALLQEYAVLIGGPMMGKMVLDKDIKDTYVTKTTGGIIILPMNHPLVVRRKQSIGHIMCQTSSACIQCDFCTELCPRYLKGHPLHPHEVMKAFGFGDFNNAKLAQASLCCECGICELYSCPMGLSPRIVNSYVKKRLRDMGKDKVEFGAQEVHSMEEYRKLPTDILVNKISVNKYYGIHDFDYISYNPNTVRIALSQHIGKTANPVVTQGDLVTQGQLIAKVDFTDMGACIHASISGRVSKVEKDWIEIWEQEAEQ